MLAFGAGTYLWIGTVECFPCLMEAHQPKEILLRLMSKLLVCHRDTSFHSVNASFHIVNDSDNCNTFL